MENLSNLDKLNAIKCKLFEIGVNCFMLPIVMNEIFPTSLNLKLKCLLKKPTHDDIIEAKEVYIQQSFGGYKGKLVLRN